MDERKVFFVRHAEANYPEMGQGDIDRTLTTKGEKDAQKLGTWLKQNNYFPDKTFVSSAKRTTQTANIIAKNLNYPSEKLIFESSLYQASVLGVIDLLQQIPNEVSSLMVIGHNPTMMEMIPYLTTNSGTHFPPCTISLISFSINWSQITAKKGSFLWLNTPNDLNIE